MGGYSTASRVVFLFMRGSRLWLRDLAGDYLLVQIVPRQRVLVQRGGAKEEKNSP
jgi:hypothetical protein